MIRLVNLAISAGTGGAVPRAAISGAKKPGIAAGRGFLFRLWGLVFQHMCLESLKRFRADHVLDPAGIADCGIGRYAQPNQPGRQKFMALINTFRNFAAGFR